MNKVRAAYKRLDYNNGDFLAHYQWRVMQDSIMFVWKGLQDDEDGMWTTDGHYYLFTYLAMLKGLDYKEAEKLGRYAERPDTHVISFEDFKERDYKLPDGRIIHLKAGQVVMGEEEIVTIPKGYKVGDMLENTTWILGGFQQRNHALTGDKHGVELAATTYAIVYREYLGMESDFEHYLLHRFGDCFAHFDVMNDAVASINSFIADMVDFVPVGYLLMSPNGQSVPMPQNFIVKTEDNRYKCTFSSVNELHEYIRNSILPSTGEISVIDNTFRSDIKAYLDPNHMDPNVSFFKNNGTLTQYMKAIDNYIESNYQLIGVGTRIEIAGNGLSTSLITRGKMIYRRNNHPKYATTLSKQELTMKVIKSIIEAKDLRGGSPLAYAQPGDIHVPINEIIEDILVLLPDAPQNTLTMYGANTNIKDFTWGHGSDNGLPDDILRRPKLYMAYVKRAAELIDLMYGSSDSVNNKNAIDRFQKIIDWGVEQYKSGNFKDENGQDNAGTKLDAVFAFAIAYEYARKNELTEFYISIKHLPSEISTLFPFATKARLFYGLDRDDIDEDFTKASEEQRKTVEKFVKNTIDVLGIPSVKIRARGVSSGHLTFDFIK